VFASDVNGNDLKGQPGAVRLKWRLLWCFSTVVLGTFSAALQFYFHLLLLSGPVGSAVDLMFGLMSSQVSASNSGVHCFDELGAVG